MSKTRDFGTVSTPPVEPWKLKHCPKCGTPSTKFYVQEGDPEGGVPEEDQIYRILVFKCANGECRNEWEEVYHGRESERKLRIKLERGLSKWELDRGLNLKIRRVA